MVSVHGVPICGLFEEPRQFINRWNNYLIAAQRLAIQVRETSNGIETVATAQNVYIAFSLWRCKGTSNVIHPEGVGADLHNHPHAGEITKQTTYFI